MTTNTKNTIESMSLEERVGQLFMLAFSGSRLDEAKVLISERGVGGCYLSRDNADTPAAAARLSEALQAARSPKSDGVPLLLGVDQEGTWAAFVPESATGPGNMALGAAADPEITRKMYKVIGSEMSAIGYNTLLAPCVDVCSDPENPIVGMRSFGQHAKEVARLARAAVTGAREGGVLATAKHFPGHGNTATDSHRNIPRVDRSRTQLEQVDFLPFRAAIEAGADIVMTSHILYPALDAERPATMSPAILNGLLRAEMGFSGLILSDSMNMGAIRKNYSPIEGAVLALAAGVDMVMLAEEHYDHDRNRYLATQIEMIDGVVRAVQEGTLSSERVNEALARVLALKAKVAGGQSVRGSFAEVGGESHRAIEREAAERSVCLLRARSALVPFGPAPRIAVVNATTRSSYDILTRTRGIGPNQAESAADVFLKELAARIPGIEVAGAEEVLASHSIPRTLVAAEIVVVLLEDYQLPGVSFDKRSQSEVITRLNALSEKMVLVALCDPYALKRYDRAAVWISSCSSRGCAARATIRALTGEIPFSGNSPLDL